MRQKSQSEQALLGPRKFNQRFSQTPSHNSPNLDTASNHRLASPPNPSSNFNQPAKVTRNTNHYNQKRELAPRTAPAQDTLDRNEIYTNNSSDNKLYSGKKTNLEHQDDYLLDSSAGNFEDPPNWGLETFNSTRQLGKKPCPLPSLTAYNKESEVSKNPEYYGYHGNPSTLSRTPPPQNLEISPYSEKTPNGPATGNPKIAPHFFFPNDTNHLSSKYATSKTGPGSSSNIIDDPNSINSKESNPQNRRKIMARNPLELREIRDKKNGTVGSRFQTLTPEENKNFLGSGAGVGVGVGQSPNIGQSNNNFNFEESENYSNRVNSSENSDPKGGYPESHLALVKKKSGKDSGGVGGSSLEKKDWHSSVRNSNESETLGKSDFQKVVDNFLKTNLGSEGLKNSQGLFFSNNDGPVMSERNYGGKGEAAGEGKKKSSQRNIDIYAAYGTNELPEKIDKALYMRLVQENLE